MVNILTIDVEDWYQSSTELLSGNDKRRVIYPSDRVVKNTRKLLQILRENDAKGTFFILGTVAERFAELILDIRKEGHEIGTHGYSHHPVYSQSIAEFSDDLKRSVSLIEGIAGEKIVGYRAPYFSITNNSLWALDILLAAGLKYDSSVFPMRRKLYGIPDAPRYPYVIRNSIGSSLLELPASTFRVMGRNIPTGGGGYLRLLPYSIIKAGIKQANRRGYPAVLYVHPYELDTNEEMIPSNNRTLRDHWVKITQEVNRASFERKLRAMLREFNFTSARSYLDADGKEIMAGG